MGFFGQRRGRSGSAEFAGHLEEHLDGMYRIALRYTRDPSRAEDLVQDTVVRALRFKDRYTPGTNFRAWVYTILTRVFIQKYRRSKRERELLDGHTREDVRAQLGSEAALEAARAPEKTFFDRLLSDDVTVALDALPEPFRMVIVLCDIEGLSYREIAEMLECPVGTVMSRLHRGRRILQGKLTDVAYEEGILRRPQESKVLDLSAYREQKVG